MPRHFRALSLFLAVIVAAALPSAPRAQVAGPIIPTGTIRMISGGPGYQTLPRVSGSRVSYTHRATVGAPAAVHVYDLLTGLDAAVDATGEYNDSFADISGNSLVFTRADGHTQRIAFLDLSQVEAGVQVLPSPEDVRRTNPAVGGGTVAFQQSTGIWNYTEVCVANVLEPTVPAQCLTNDGTLYNLSPAVSPDGEVVVFQKCIGGGGSDCDIHAARRNPDGSWAQPVAITSGGANDIAPATNGSIVVYASDATGDFDIYYESVTGTGTATRLELTDAPGSQEVQPRISGSLITMTRMLPGEANADIYMVDIATNTLYRLPPTPDVHEVLNDVDVQPDGTVNIVWVASGPPESGNPADVHGFSFRLPGAATYAICSLFDTSRAHRAGRVVPIKVQLCDPNGTNLSRSDLVLTAEALVQRDTTASSTLAPDDAGASNDDGLFRYDATLGGYVFNLSTSGLTTGTWELQFKVTGDPTVYGIRFDVR